MYDKLIKRLRASCENCKLWDGYKCCLKGECSAQKSLQAADGIKELLAEREENYADSWKMAFEVERDTHRWIPVTERLPELGEVVLLTDGKDTGDGYLAMYDFSTECPLWSTPFVDLETENITHWMPLPEPPKDGES